VGQTATAGHFLPDAPPDLFIKDNGNPPKNLMA
jgi:hypothetical protein